MAGCRPILQDHQNKTFLPTNLEDQLIDELNSYDLKPIVSSEANVDNVLNKILNDLRIKYFSHSNEQLVNGLFDEIYNNSSILFNAVEKLKSRIKTTIGQQKLPEILIWFVQEKQLTKSQIDFVQRM